MCHYQILCVNWCLSVRWKQIKVRSIHFKFSLKVLIGLSLICVSASIGGTFYFWELFEFCTHAFVAFYLYAIKINQPIISTFSFVWWSRHGIAINYKIHLGVHGFLSSTFLFGSSYQIVNCNMPDWSIDRSSLVSRCCSIASYTLLLYCPSCAALVRTCGPSKIMFVIVPKWLASNSVVWALYGNGFLCFALFF